ncbi:MAG: AsmA family protein, partial [Thermodesulfobacteriota bacterium]
MKFKKIFKYIGIFFAVLLILLLVILIAFDWNWLKPYLNDRLSDLSGRSLVIEGDIDVDLGWTTRIELEDLRFENADWGSKPQMARVEAAEIDVKLMPLLDGNIILPRLRLKKPWLLLETSEQGRGNWNLSPDSDAQKAEEPSGTDLPVIESLMIEDGEIRYRDPSAGTDLQGAIATEPAENGGHRIIIDAGGELLDSPLAFGFTGDPLTDLQETGITYQVRMTAEMGQSRGEAEGVIHQPLHFQGMDLNVTIQGPDFSTPAALWDDDFPETPPYRIDTHLILENGVWKLTESTVSLGESDFTGSVIIDPTADPLAVTADLDFDLLEVEQLTAIFKGEEKTEPEAPSETPLDASFLTGLNADIQVRADSIVMPKVSVNRGGFHLLLEDGRLRI